MARSLPRRVDLGSGRADLKHHEFIDKVAAQTVWGDEPTERMHKYLHSLFYKLGAKIT
jgi:hypothetical protein